MTELFLGEIILESVTSPEILASLEPFVIKTRTEERPMETPPLWHLSRYRLPREQVLAYAPRLTKSFSNGGWYIHFFSENGADLVVILRERFFLLPKTKDSSWDEMITYGESVGVGHQWTETIPTSFSD